MKNGSMVGVLVVVLVAVFAVIALPEITTSLANTQSTASGISTALDLALDSFPFVLIIGVIAILAMVVSIGSGR